MRNISDAERMLNSLFAPLGDYAPQKRQLIVDYKDSSGADFNNEHLSWHNRETPDESLVEAVRVDLNQKGYKLTAISELCENGRNKVLYLSPGYLKEFLAEMGLSVPKNLCASLKAAGIRPVNWAELVNEARKNGW